jgi:membrane protein implicated in regulation of membrane protease activity
MNVTPMEIWIILGLIFILIEFTFIPGIGLLFLGFGGLSTGVIIYYFPQIIESQIISFGLSSFAWFLLLWWPLKISLYRKKGKDGGNYFDIVGTRVKVVSLEIKASELGKVHWSGTIMNARFIDSDSEPASEGEELYVIAVQGNILVCSRDDLNKTNSL